MRRPLTMPEAEARGLVKTPGVQTFANGTEWECWAEGNCYLCRYWDPDTAGERCAFEGAALLHMVSPELRALFGWTEDPEWTYHVPPEVCPFFRNRSDRDGNDNPPPPPNDPLQLVLIADPTEDAALITQADALVEVHAP